MRPLFIAAVCLCSMLVPALCLGQRSPSAEQDSLLAAYGNTLVALRDSADVVRSALDQFRRDLQAAGDRTVISRAARLNGTCAALVGLLRDARPIFRAYRAPNQAGREANRTLQAQTGTLETALSSHCLGGLAGSGGTWSRSPSGFAQGMGSLSLVQTAAGAVCFPCENLVHRGCSRDRTQSVEPGRVPTGEPVQMSEGCLENVDSL
jgi:hypothetical protein